ncbi:hypothetical protein AAFF_G00104250 [Aldrovandia affinis]|uniref:Uncharacterized protein n=1 Tax=Aldrovandia affinis TaxID=143900 RepID=A0AAD7WXQ5_9TELE|nr:hypothetical protein AAFF_G00104250 [Aldrovandia affinis]
MFSKPTTALRFYQRNRSERSEVREVGFVPHSAGSANGLHLFKWPMSREGRAGSDLIGHRVRPKRSTRPQ